MRVLIIGGSRFMGKHLLFKLSEEEHDITVINRGNKNIDYPSNCTHIKADRTNPNELNKKLDGLKFDWVFDFYAMKGEETKQIIEIINGRVERFIHISTILVYDLKKQENYPTLPVFEEDQVGNIENETFWYAREKRLSEKYLCEAFEQYNFPMTIIRPTYVYGPDNHIYRERYFFDRITNERPVFIPKPGNCYFDLVYVDDVVNLCILAAKNRKSLGQKYNATGSEIISGEALTNLIGDIVGKKSIIEYYSDEDLKAIEWPNDEDLYPYPSENFKFFSNLKAVHELGFKPKYRLREGMNFTYNWSLKQNFPKPDWSLEEKLLKYIQNK